MSGERPVYAVLLFPQAVEALGDAIAPYLRTERFGPHLVGKRISSTGPYFELAFDGQSPDGRPVEIQMMLPHGFIRMVFSVQGEGRFGFEPGRYASAVQAAPDGEPVSSA